MAERKGDDMQGRHRAPRDVGEEQRMMELAMAMSAADAGIDPPPPLPPPQPSAPHLPHTMSPAQSAAMHPRSHSPPRRQSGTSPCAASGLSSGRRSSRHSSHGHSHGHSRGAGRLAGPVRPPVMSYGSGEQTGMDLVDTSQDEELARRLQAEEDGSVEADVQPQVSAAPSGSRSIRRSLSRKQHSGALAGNPWPDEKVCVACRQPLSRSASGGISGLLSRLGGASYVSFPHAPHRAYHLECLKCASCGQTVSPQDRVAIEGDDVYHHKCLIRARRPKCACCKEVIPSERPGSGHIRYINNSFWKEKYCVRHARDDPSTVSCTSCCRLRTLGSEDVVAIGDGRHTCLQCLELMVHDTPAAQPLYHSILDWYKSLSMPHREQPPFMLVDSSALNEYRSKEGHGGLGSSEPITHTRGLCLYEWYETIRVGTISRGARGRGGGLTSQSSTMSLRNSNRGGGGGRERRRHVSVTAILVLAGMSWLLTGAVLAHELMHAWLRMEGFGELPPQVEEGLCQLMAYLWLEGQRFQEGHSAERIAAYVGHTIREDTSPVYGDGFRAALRSYQAIESLPQMLGYVRETHDFPLGCSSPPEAADPPYV